ncbi:MAG: carboxylating nicotinate-nucleotide diphosphorylase [Candidatus Omnitrophica bacterium]|nr:carboxylating nicotinate-nucleotide diphosphorylase [Candidatus Omnitrophota bacterium]MBU1870225.1 carboxylating nicotinate-nucleotide diphosphorylase [Candidatus Omnitrophota bacterium]
MGLNSFDKELRGVVFRALSEDIGKGDITSKIVIPAHKKIKAVFLAKEPCVTCGLNVASITFRSIDKNIKFRPMVKEGQAVRKGTRLAAVEGNARSILSAERVALNFIAMLSGIATKTREYVEAVKPFRVKIMDTRKTTPGLRHLQKYAVKAGGGCNHRMGLYDMVLVKDNHLKAISLKDLIYRIKEKAPESMKIEIEVDNLKDFIEVLKARPDIIMLDNMSIPDMKKAVNMRYGLRPKLEASGGITLQNIRKVASTGVDMISIGALTHSIKSVDISLEFLLDG